MSYRQEWNKLTKKKDFKIFLDSITLVISLLLFLEKCLKLIEIKEFCLVSCYKLLTLLWQMNKILSNKMKPKTLKPNKQ